MSELKPTTKAERELWQTRAAEHYYADEADDAMVMRMVEDIDRRDAVLARFIAWKTSDGYGALAEIAKDAKAAMGE